MGYTLDRIDLDILKKLQENSNITNVQLAAAVGLSPAPTLERVKKIEAAGFIKSYHALVNEASLGIGLKMLMQISLSRQQANAIERFKEHIESIEEVVECYQVTGDTDFVIKILTHDIAAFERLIAEKFSTMDEIGQMKTMVVLSQTKHSKVIPIKYE